ncbi:sensor domain-containing protein [Domibacillus tundrae]|uniref:sensor domain-containing protein n=1 Tax=Domibacillus tundrae TaxID=1587527 RepID=UPI00339446E1
MNIHQGIQSIIDSFHDHIVIVDKHGMIAAVNKAWEKFGLENGQSSSTIGANYLAVLHNEQNSEALQAMLRILNKKSSYEELSYPCHSPNEERWFQMVIEPLHLSEKENGVIVIHQNRTAEVQAEYKLKDMLESMTDAFFSLDEHWKFIYINEEAERVLGKKREELQGRGLWAEFPEAVQEKFYENYMLTMNERVTTRFEEYHQPLNSWFEVVAYPSEYGGLSVFFHDINKRKEAEQKMHFYAYQDDLTELPNRRGVFKEIKQKIENGSSFSLLFLDLNGFKQINDTYGHDKGDELLKKVGARLQHSIGVPHFIGRLGGDEFLILINGCGQKEEVQPFIDQISACFDRPFGIDDHTSFTISTSIGISFYPYHSKEASTLVSMADTAMYEAKHSRKQEYIVYHPDMHEKIERRLHIEQGLAGDLREAGISFVLQPQMDMKEQIIIGAEVLSRWHHPVYGFIPPNEFIAIAEESGYMLKLASYMFCEIFIEMKKWIVRDRFNIRISFNVTSDLIASESFFDDLFDLIERFGIPTKYIELEITEEAEMTASRAVMQNLLRCRKQGIIISIDDFGTGYSTFAYLTDFPVDKMKIDKYFIDQIGANERTEAILKSMIQLSANLDCEVIAEGVETKEQLHFLIEHSCHAIQGYYVDRPLSIQVFEEKYVRGEQDGTVNSN